MVIKMSKRILINKDTLQEYEKVEIVCENLETFTVDVNDIIDVEIVGEKKSRCKKGEYFSNRGYIIFSSFIKSKMADDAEIMLVDKTFTKEDFMFSNRISKYLDITWLDFINKNGEKVSISIPYDVVESDFDGIKELSNCHSFELDNDNLVIKYGELSTMPKRNKIPLSMVVENGNILENIYTEDLIGFEVKMYHIHEKEDNMTLTLIGVIEYKKKVYSVKLIFNGVTEYREYIDGDISYLIFYKLSEGANFIQVGNVSEFNFEKCYVEYTSF